MLATERTEDAERGSEERSGGTGRPCAEKLRGEVREPCEEREGFQK